ncbi:hypothetical protein [Nitrosomonas marina]|uniref:Uncharacterized protein n=1 Tax=Nitrosomonas marina TaxID=917 RepID=A0A1H8AMZ2_9PROT|nr:hypothetical protein [Nitrosomonas marina]SEM72021.1 hypothetical protein SAMN05216325_101237 [Nitrosomonas marina]
MKQLMMVRKLTLLPVQYYSSSPSTVIMIYLTKSTKFYTLISILSDKSWLITEVSSRLFVIKDCVLENDVRKTSVNTDFAFSKTDNTATQSAQSHSIPGFFPCYGIPLDKFSLRSYKINANSYIIAIIFHSSDKTHVDSDLIAEGFIEQKSTDLLRTIRLYAPLHCHAKENDVQSSNALRTWNTTGFS